MERGPKSRLQEGAPFPLGATLHGNGVNFALFSAHAEKVELCLFDGAGAREIERLPLPGYSDEVWHGYLPDTGPGLVYGYRVHGPYDPLNGHRFNPYKLLIDPYARALTQPFAWNDIHCGYTPGDPRGDLSFDTRDNAAWMPKCRVTGAACENADGRERPGIPLSQSVIYELHVRGYTMRHPSVDKTARGTFAGLRHPDVIGHLRSLGITAVELLPVHAFATTRALSRHGLREYWGYNSIGFFAPEPRYLASGNADEFRATVGALHEAGIEVILDVVFNHSGEGDELGPTLCFRGIDNASYYCLAEDKRRYLDFTGCRNTLNFDHPRVLQLAMDSLRYWACEMNVDGFRFDLAVSLSRENHHFSGQAKLLAAIAQDPVLSRLKLIAEPWDLGPDGYQLGAFPPGWSEWNDKFRDDVRRFWRGEDGRTGALASRLTGSSDIFGRRGRRPQASVNYVTAHDGFTLEDLVRYEIKRNQDNKEGNEDGTDANYSWNCGVEGPSDDPRINVLRERQKRNILATLLFSQGVPMLLAGDELGRSQNGNNNAYCQDNDVSWVDWTGRETNGGFLEFVRHVIAIRARFPVFRRTSFFDGRPAGENGDRDIRWLRPDGHDMTDADWRAPHSLALAVLFAPVADSAGPGTGTAGRDALLLLMNAGAQEVGFTLPQAAPEERWRCLVDTAMADVEKRAFRDPGTLFHLAPHALALLAAGGGNDISG